MGNGAAEEDWRWDLNPGTAAMLGEDHRALVEKGEDHAALAEWGPLALMRVRTMWLWGAPFCHTALEAGETLPGRKGVRGLLLGGHEKVPHSFGLTGDHGSSTADGAGTEGLPEPQASTSFPEIWYPGLAKGEKEGMCAFVGIL